ncbi:MAG: DUF3883 domain-containing protein [Proteobacteria bacterium]|nr:DUF3883 domain-containing protein [Pseudomonadota bacterium]MBU4287384.1 DUF3883 domain-containing protein [Pseudomonadota bacterium]MBU4414840.1 DUF3883 domain-containing protein [Pseudomonadota bacterium]MCG2759417.1 DUF3883 domain-containing protein [Desulfobacteraceae bacterium]
MDTTFETINNAKGVVDNIRQEIEDARGTYIWDDYVNALRLISQVVFTRGSGFILEFIQNAEDSGLDVSELGHFEIKINQQRVKITHNGSPFNENDVKAISGIRSSKKPERGFLGYLGIGFKSVLKITDRPEIYSNGFQFKFDRTHWPDPSSTPWHVIPIWLDEPSESVDASGTTFIIPFRESTDASRITEEIKKIRLELYLFLRWLRKIEIVDEVSGEHWTLENLGENQEGISTLKSDGEERRFKFFRRNVAVPEWVKEDRLTQEYRANVTHREIAIGFALDKDGNLAPDEAGAMYGGVYSFLPLGEAKSGAKFPIQADFLVQPGRDALNYEAKWNHWILEEVVNLVFDAISFFKTHDTWKYQYLPAFEFTHSKGLEPFEKLFYPKLIEPIEKHLTETESVLTIDDQWAKLNDVIRLTEEDQAVNDLLRLQLFRREEIASAFGRKENLRLVHPKVVEQKNHPLAKANRWNLLENSELLQAKSKEQDAGTWFARLYLWLRDNPLYEEYFYYTVRYRTLGYHKYEVVLTAQGDLKKGGDVYIPDLSSDNPALNELAALLQSSKPIIHPDILSSAVGKESESLRGFLTGFVGVQLLNAKTICKEMILPKIVSKAPQPSPDELLSLTKLCKEILGTDLGDDIELWIKTKSGNIKTSKEVFLSSEFKPLKNWEKHQAFVTGLNFIDNAYLKNDPSDEDLKTWRGFFGAAGIRENPDNGVEQFAINFALDKLKGKYQNIQLVEKLNYGFDIQAATPDGVPIQVEVKGLSSEQDVELTGNEADAADTYRSSFYLCVVASIPNLPTIYLVNNPASVGKKDKLTIPVDVWKVSETI